MTYYPEFALEALSRKKEEWRMKKIRANERVTNKGCAINAQIRPA